MKLIIENRNKEPESVLHRLLCLFLGHSNFRLICFDEYTINLECTRCGARGGFVKRECNYE